MAKLPVISFVSPDLPTDGRVIVFAGKGLALGPLASKLDNITGNLISKVAELEKFTGEKKSSISILAPANSELSQIVVLGIGDVGEYAADDWARLGGATLGCLDKNAFTIVLEKPDGQQIADSDQIDFLSGINLRAYDFDKYKTKEKDKKQEENADHTIIISAADPGKLQKLWAVEIGVSAGVMLARDLVNEPANILGTLEFADKAKELESLGCEVDIIGEAKLAELGMGALLGVGQGSSRPSFVAVIKWNGGKQGEQPLAFVGKGVVFDTGGISIKPAGGMEDMKGDMGGAAAVCGLMHALAARKANVNIVGLLGLVENQPDGNAQRPGDIVTSMSGQTIEVINTDAEGRLVLADVLWYTQKHIEPSAIIDLATLTGAMVVAFAGEYAGYFSNDDELARQLFSAGEKSGDKVWRLPLGKAYDKMIDTPNADMKNSAGRWGGAITAAQFLQRFVNDTPWIHIDIAGAAMGSPKNEICQGWASGFGVRLLDRFVRDNFEA